MTNTSKGSSADLLFRSAVLPIECCGDRSEKAADLEKQVCATRYEYDAAGRLMQAGDSMTGTVARGYGGLDRLISEVTPQGSVSYTYDAAGPRTGLGVSGQSVVSYSYDNGNRITQIAQGVSNVSFTYDSDNRRTSLTLPNGVTMSYSYDVASELVGINYQIGNTVLGNLTYTYDLAGRRTAPGGSYAQTGLPSAVAGATFNADGQMTQFGSSSFTYDANGNLTSDGTHAYTWDARNHLVSISGAASASFQYDAFGRRVSKTIGAVTTNYLYDGVNPVQELSGGSPTANILTGLGVDERFQRTDASGPAYYLTDALGSTITLTGPTGNTLAQYKYDPFGNVTITGSSSNPYQFTGRENDGTGLYYYRARYYEPSSGRFVSPDPIGLNSSGANLYAYVQNNPISYVDRLGLDITPAQQAAIQTAAEDWAASRVPYKWGGKSKKGADCSGSVFGIYNQAGMHIPYMVSSAFSNSKLFSPVKGALQIGDIGVYEGHVVIYGGSTGPDGDNIWTAFHTGGPAFGPSNSAYFGDVTWYRFN